jgi:chromosome segregation and condensation protein ScpB
MTSKEPNSSPEEQAEKTPALEAAAGLDPARSAVLERVVAQVRPGTGQADLEVCAQLFSAHKPLTAEELAANLVLSAGEIERALARLESSLLDSPFAIFRRTLTPKGRRKPVTGYVLDLKATYRRNVATVGRPVLGQGPTETLALIALNQPISQSRLVRERGSSVYDHVKELRARDWVQKVKSGRSYELRTTAAFAAEFGLENDPQLIKSALARAAGVENVVDLVASARVAFPTEGQELGHLRDEAQAFAPTPEELEAREATEAARQRALEELRLAEDVEAVVEVLAEASADLPPLPREDCLVSGGEAPARFDAGEGVLSGGAPPAPNRIAGALDPIQSTPAQSTPTQSTPNSEAVMKTDDTTDPTQDTPSSASDDSQSTSRVAHLLSLIDDDATTDDW